MHVRLATAGEMRRYNDFVAAAPTADVLQTYEWGEVKRASGWEPIRLIVEEAGDLRGACSILITSPVRGYPPLAYAPRGPILDPQDATLMEIFLEGVREHLGGAFVFCCDPAVEEGSASARAMAERLSVVRSGGFGGVQPKAVMVLELEHEPDALLTGFKSKWRYNVRLAAKKGVTVREGGRADVGIFYDLLRTTASRDRFAIRDRSYFDVLWEILGPSEMIRIFVAEFQGRPLASIILFCLGNKVTYVYGASSDEHRNLMPNHLIQWEAIKWAKQAGYSVYDFQGVSPVENGVPVDKELAGLNRFKEGFGARYVEYAGQFDLPLRPGWYRLWRASYPTAIAVAKRIRRS